MKKVVILSGVAALFLGACTSTGGGSLKSTEDSLAYAMGLDMGMNSALAILSLLP